MFNLDSTVLQKKIKKPTFQEKGAKEKTANLFTRLGIVSTPLTGGWCHRGRALWIIESATLMDSLILFPVCRWVHPPIGCIQRIHEAKTPKGRGGVWLRYERSFGAVLRHRLASPCGLSEGGRQRGLLSTPSRHRTVDTRPLCGFIGAMIPWFLEWRIECA